MIKYIYQQKKTTTGMTIPPESFHETPTKSLISAKYLSCNGKFEPSIVLKLSQELS